MANGAHEDYINIISKDEYLYFRARFEDNEALDSELHAAELTLSHCRRVLEILIEVLGYVPKAFIAKLIPEPKSE